MVNINENFKSISCDELQDFSDRYFHYFHENKNKTEGKYINYLEKYLDIIDHKDENKNRVNIKKLDEIEEFIKRDFNEFIKNEKWKNKIIIKNKEIPIMTDEQGKRCYEHKKSIYLLPNENDRIMSYEIPIVNEFYEKYKYLHSDHPIILGIKLYRKLSSGQKEKYSFMTFPALLTCNIKIMRK